MTLNTPDARDLALRAFHTFWQAFVAVFGGLVAAGGLSVSQVDDMASAKKLALALALAAGAAALSAVKTTVATLVPALMIPDDTGPGFIEEPATGKHAAPEDAAEPAPVA